MKSLKMLLIFLGLGILAFAQKPDCTSECCKAKEKKGRLTCKLTSSEFRERKATFVANLKKQVLEKKELKDGYAYKFSGSDTTVDELINFIKTERQCCDFFTFNLSVRGDKSESWLHISGPKGTKEFIRDELDM
jgi:hypothetical protein